MKVLETLTLAVALSGTVLSVAVGAPTAPQPQPVTTTVAPRPATAKPATRPPVRRATSGRLDGIAATVNDDVVLQSDVEEQLYLFLMRNPGANPDSADVDTLRRQILQQLIDEKLIVAEAKRQGVSATDAEVARQVDQALEEARQRMGTSDAFAEQLRKENLTEDKLRQKYRSEVVRQLLAQRLVQKQIVRRTVTAAEAEAFFKAHRDRFPKAPAEVRLSVIQIPVHADSAADASAKAKAMAARKRLLAGEKFAKVAAEVSDDPGSAKSGGDLGFFIQGQMDPGFEKAAFAQKLGEIGDLVHTAFGWHVIEVLERDTVKTRAGKDSLDAQGKPVLEAHVRHVLARADVQDDDVERAKSLAERVHAEAAKGTDFATLVKRYSQYQGAQSADGDIGFLSMAALQPNIAAGIDSLPVGRISQVLANRAGFNIFKVTDRKPEREYALEEIKDELPEAVAQIQAKEKYEEWVKTLRSKAVIRIMKS